MHKYAWFVVAAVLSAVNLALFFFWLSLVRIEVVAPEPTPRYTLDDLALHVSLTEVMVAGGAIAFALLGFLGFQDIKASAERRAQEAAQAAAEREIANFLTRHGESVGVKGVLKPQITGPTNGTRFVPETENEERS